MHVVDTKPYEGITFKHMSNTREQTDCFNLCRRVLLEHHGIEIPYTTLDLCKDDREDWYNHSDYDYFLVNATKDKNWKTIAPKDIKPYDIVLIHFGSSGCTNHAGLYVGNGKILHIMTRTKSTVTEYGPYYKSHTNRIIRWKTL